MKRYFAFIVDSYYPSGGMDDFIGDFDTIDEAISQIKTHIFNPIYQNSHIYDTENKIKICSTTYL